MARGLCISPVRHGEKRRDLDQMDYGLDMTYKTQTLAILLMGWVVAASATGITRITFPDGPETAAMLPTPLVASMSKIPSYQTVDGIPDILEEDIAPVVDLDAPSVSHLKEYFQAVGYDWRDKAPSVPRVRLATFPEDIDDVSTPSERKQLFFQSMLPIMLMENERILKHRARMLAMFERIEQGQKPGALDMIWLNELARNYRVKGDPTRRAARVELTKRVNQVPLSLALAMSAFESGWGTSRFADEGNNLFGEWTFRRGTGIIPNSRTEGLYHELAVFPDLTSSVRSYLNNLNSHWAYQEFRNSRAQIADLNHPDAPVQLAHTLLKYSERGRDYTNDIARLIQVNRLTRFDATSLAGPDA